jgi:hypothetical protein
MKGFFRSSLLFLASFAIAFSPVVSFAQSPERLETKASPATSVERVKLVYINASNGNVMPNTAVGPDENLSASASVKADKSIVHAIDNPGVGVSERLVPLNMVNLTARHCAKYLGKLAENSDAWKAAAKACDADPSTVYFTHTEHNLRTNAGGDWQASVMGNTAAQPASCNYIAVSNDATAPAAGDTTLASEIAANGLTRAQGTYAHTNGTSSYTIQKVFSATGTQASQKTALFNASSVGTMCFENTYTQVTVNNGDTLTVTWTVNI